MAGKPRILIVANVSWFFVSHRLALAVAIRDAGFDVQVVAAPDETVEECERAGLPFHPLPMQRGHSGLVADLLTVRALTTLYRQLRPAIAHHVTLKPVLYGSLAARLARVPHTVNAVTGRGSMLLAPGLGARFRNRVAHQTLRLVGDRRRSWFLFQNTTDRDEFVYERIVASDRGALIPGSGVDLARYRFQPEPPGVPLVVFPARMLKDKGLVEFVEAARYLRRAGVRARFALVGGLDPANPSAVSSATINAWVAEGAIEWWGRRSDMPEVLAASHLVCLPSYREGMPKALLEAAASGRAIVTTDVPGCRDCVDPGRTGLLVPACDPAALAQALRELLEDPARREHFGRAGRALAEREFGLQLVVDRHLALYRDVLSS